MLEPSLLRYLFGCVHTWNLQSRIAFRRCISLPLLRLRLLLLLLSIVNDLIELLFRRGRFQCAMRLVRLMLLLAI